MRRGSTKSLTFSVYRGQQITKDRVTDIANPQTQAQMMQRLKVPMVANARSALKELVDHSFEGYAYGESSLKRFSSLNLQTGNLTVTQYVPKNIMDCGLANFVISDGSLPEQKVQLDYNNNDLKSSFFRVFTNLSKAPVVKDEISVKEGESITDELLQQLCNVIGLSADEQLTFLAQTKGDTYAFPSDDDSTEYEGHYHLFVVSRFINNIDKVSNWKIQTDANAGNAEISITDGFMSLTFLLGETQDGHSIEASVTDSYIGNGLEAACCVYSRQENAVWRRSPQRMVVGPTPPIDKSTQDYTNVVYTYLKPSTASAKYLNTGMQGVGITGGNA